MNLSPTVTSLLLVLVNVLGLLILWRVGLPF